MESVVMLTSVRHVLLLYQAFRSGVVRHARNVLCGLFLGILHDLSNLISSHKSEKLRATELASRVTTRLQLFVASIQTNNAVQVFRQMAGKPKNRLKISFSV